MMNIRKEIYNAGVSEIVQEVYLKLKNEDEEYKELREELKELYTKNPSVEGIISGENFVNLNRNECEKIRDVVLINEDLKCIEEIEIFTAGAKEMYHILKKLDLLK